jgi:hypothetical protein
MGGEKKNNGKSNKKYKARNRAYEKSGTPKLWDGVNGDHNNTSLMGIASAMRNTTHWRYCIRLATMLPYPGKPRLRSVTLHSINLGS